MRPLNDVIAEKMPNLVYKHGFAAHAIGEDEVLMIKGSCLILIFRDREGISVGSVFVEAGGMREYSLGHYLVTKRNATHVVASGGFRVGDNQGGKAVGELIWYDHALSMCAEDILAGSVDWISDYPGKPIPLAEPTSAKIREVLRTIRMGRADTC
jgi:hypothetical protein